MGQFSQMLLEGGSYLTTRNEYGYPLFSKVWDTLGVYTMEVLFCQKLISSFYVYRI